MRPFFQSPERRARLAAEAAKLVGTPFALHRSDCIHLSARLLMNCGHLREFTPPAYTLDGGTHNQSSLVIDWLRAHPQFAEIDDAPVAGDVVCLKFGRVPFHVGVMVTERKFLHTYVNVPAYQARIDDPTFSRRLQAVFRPMEAEVRA